MKTSMLSTGTGPCCGRKKTRSLRSSLTSKMRAAISLLVLLFSMCGAQTRSTQTEVQTESQSTGAAAAAAGDVSTQLDISAELKELRDMVHKQEIMLVELRVLLAANQNELQDTKVEMKTEVENLKKENGALETKLAVTATEVEALKVDSAAHEQELAALKTRLAATETGMGDLKVENAAQEAELAAVKTGLTAIETEVENLEKITEKSKVAFSASLGISGYIESGSNNLNLVFSNIFTNVGQAYSSRSGFFTAPVRGVYYFRFTVKDILDSHWMFIQMCKNGERIMQLGEYDNDGFRTYLSSGLTLQLEVGDEVNLVLPAGYRLNDDSYNNCIFSGFLLFTL